MLKKLRVSLAESSNYVKLIQATPIHLMGSCFSIFRGVEVSNKRRDEINLFFAQESH